MAKTANKKDAPTKTLEQTLWEAADKMRGNLEAGEYKHVVLGLVFLKYVSDAFEERRAWLETATADPANDDYFAKNPDRRSEIIEDRNEYTSENVFWVPTEARWQFLQDRAKQPEIGVLIDHAISPHEGRESSRTFGTRIISGLFVRQKSEACGPRPWALLTALLTFWLASAGLRWRGRAESDWRLTQWRDLACTGAHVGSASGRSDHELGLCELDLLRRTSFER